MRLVVIGTSNMTICLAKVVLDAGVELALMATLTDDLLPDNSADISGFCQTHNIECLAVSDINDDASLRALDEVNPDYIISSWPKILRKEFLDIPRRCVVGTHPALLPMNMGRHPLHWLIVLGMAYTSLHFFKMDEGIDTGDVLLSMPFSVGNRDIDAINADMNVAAYEGMKRLLSVFENCPDFSGYQQSQCTGNYLRKRNEHDVTIDPRMSVEMIERIVNSFAFPYPGARLWVSPGHVLLITRVERVHPGERSSNWQNYEHGYVFSVDDGVIMRVMDDVVRLRCQESSVGLGTICEKKIYPPSYYVSLKKRTLV